MMRRERVTLVADPSVWLAEMARARRGVTTLARLADQQTHPLDRAEPGEPTPLRWRGDDS